MGCISLSPIPCITLINDLKYWLIPFVNCLGNIDTSQPVSMRKRTLEFLSTANCRFCGRSAGFTNVVLEISNAQRCSVVTSRLVVTLTLCSLGRFVSDTICLRRWSRDSVPEFKRDGVTRSIRTVLAEADETARLRFCVRVYEFDGV